MQAEPAFQAAEVFWMEMLVSTAFFSLLAAVSVRDIWYREVSDRLQAGIVMTACLRVMFGRMKRAHIWSRCWGIPYSRFHIPEKWKSRCCKETCLKSWD